MNAGVASAPGDEREADRALAARVAGGDRSAFEALMRANNRRLYRLARATLRDDAEAEDALQDAYVQAYRSLSQYRGDAALATWLSRLVLNACYARLRKGARRQNVFPIVAGIDEADAMADEHSAPERAAMRAEVRALVERALDALPEDYRVAFVLRSVEEMSTEEAAACLGIPEATLRTRHFRARALLREALAREIDVAERDLYEIGGARCDRIVAGVVARIESGA